MQRASEGENNTSNKGGYANLALKVDRSHSFEE